MAVRPGFAKMDAPRPGDQQRIRERITQLSRQRANFTILLAATPCQSIPCTAEQPLCQAQLPVLDPVGQPGDKAVPAAALEEEAGLTMRAGPRQKSYVGCVPCHPSRHLQPRVNVMDVEVDAVRRTSQGAAA